MADVGDWSDAPLAADADVTARYSRAEDLLASGEAIADFLAIAKTEIGTRLDVILRDRRTTISSDDLADLKDLIANPTVFKDAAVAFALMRLFEKNIYEQGDFHSVQRDIMRTEFRETFDRGFSLMQFDADRSTDIEQDEEAAGPQTYRFSRT